MALTWARASSKPSFHRIALASVLVFTAAMELVFNTTAEDAFISYRYAANLADGHGLVFNLGERVEGYSNFLWTVSIAFAHWVTGADIVVVARLIGFLLVLVLVGLVDRLVLRVTDDPHAAIVAALLTGASGTVTAYGRSGLESPLFAVLVVASLLALAGDRWLGAGAALALATMTRPDGVLCWIVVAGWCLLAQGVPMRTRLHRVALLAIPYALILVPWTIWRWTYYGYLVPNAVAAKAGGDLAGLIAEGWDYFLDFSRSSLPLAILAILAALWLFGRRRRVDTHVRRMAGLVGALVVATVAYVISVGGDWMPAYRFFYLVPALLAILVGIGWSTVDRRGDDRSAAYTVVAVGIVVVMAASSVATTYRDPRMLSIVDEWRSQVLDLGETGKWFRRTLPPGSSVATYANGALSYYAGSDIEIIDVLGLTDEHIARRGQRLEDAPPGHRAYDWEYVVRRAPDVIILTGTGYDGAPSCQPLSWAPEYRPLPFQVRDGPEWVNLWLRADRFDRLAGSLAGDPAYRSEPCADRAAAATSEGAPPRRGRGPRA